MGRKITMADASEIARRSVVEAESRRAEERARDARESACAECAEKDAALAAESRDVEELKGLLKRVRDECTLHDSPVWQRANLMELIADIRARIDAKIGGGA